MVLYEDEPARALAFEVRDRLFRQFSPDLEFQFSWWRFAYLADPMVAREAGETAAQSDLTLVAARRRDELPDAVKDWFETWLPVREGGDAALVSVCNADTAGRVIDEFLPAIARRANLDFLSLTRLPSRLSVDRLREDQAFTNIAGLYQAPDHHFHSSGWGIDE